jgi:hypothetical protein
VRPLPFESAVCDLEREFSQGAVAPR